MEKIYGVIDVTSGYANGKTKNPKYQDLHSSGHAETVHVRYDASKVNLSTLLKYYFKIIDPTSVNKQGNDRGSQYRTGIYYVNQNDKSFCLQYCILQPAYKLGFLHYPYGRYLAAFRVSALFFLPQDHR